MSWTTNPALLPILTGLGGVQQAGSEEADQYWRGLMKGFLKKGKDVSSIDPFKPMIAAGAAQKRMADEASGYGDSGMIAANGTPDEQALLKRQDEIRDAKIGENTGLNIAQAIPGMVDAASNYGLQEAADTNAFNLNKFSELTNAINSGSKWVSSPWFGILSGLASGAGKAAAGFI